MDCTDIYHNSGMLDSAESVWVLFEYQKIAPVLKKWKYERDAISETQIETAFRKALGEVPHFTKDARIFYVPLGIDRLRER